MGHNTYRRLKKTISQLHYAIFDSLNIKKIDFVVTKQRRSTITSRGSMKIVHFVSFIFLFVNFPRRLLNG